MDKVAEDPSQSFAPVVERLTPRELQCLQGLAYGRSNMGIADQLGISLPTVAMHLTNARKKLGASTRTQAVARAVGYRLISS